MHKQTNTIKYLNPQAILMSLTCTQFNLRQAATKLEAIQVMTVLCQHKHLHKPTLLNLDGAA